MLDGPARPHDVNQTSNRFRPWTELSGDGATFTFAAQLDYERWVVRFGSIIFGPTGLLANTWHDWRRSQTEFAGIADVWRLHGLDASDWIEFDHTIASWRFVRFSLKTTDAVAMLTSWFSSGTFKPPAGNDLFAPIGNPRRRVELFDGIADGPQGDLVAGIGRPVHGWLQPLSPFTADDPMPASWALTLGRLPLSGVHYVLGFRSPAPRLTGVFVGAVVHPAWIRGVRGTPDRVGDFHVVVGLDPSRIAAWELVLDVEEADTDGHLLAAHQLRFRDLKLPDHGSESVTATVSSVGGRLVRRVRLHDLSGRLLDAVDNVRLLEQINLRINVMTSQKDRAASDIQLGRPAATVDAQAHLDALARSATAMREAHAAGIPQRVNAGAAVLRDRLGAARGELLVVDRYFGKHASEWELLRNVQVPIRLLRTRYTTPPPTGLAIQVRQSDPSHFHDRYYLWEDGGLHVGASPSGIDKSAVYLMTALEPVVANHLTERFETWWSLAVP